LHTKFQSKHRIAPFRPTRGRPRATLRKEITVLFVGALLWAGTCVISGNTKRERDVSARLDLQSPRTYRLTAFRALSRGVLPRRSLPIPLPSGESLTLRKRAAATSTPLCDTLPSRVKIMSPYKQHRHHQPRFEADSDVSSSSDCFDNNISMEENDSSSSPRRRLLEASSTVRVRKEILDLSDATATSEACLTPTKSRRLFWDDSSDPLSSPSHASHHRTVSKPGYATMARRNNPSKQPLDVLNHHSNVLNESISESSSASSIGSAMSTQGRRKRSSAERATTTGTPRAHDEMETALGENTGHNNTLYASPRISPNSFLTMDGRFVQSKNPFSSPMITDTPTMLQNTQQYNHHPYFYDSQHHRPSFPSESTHHSAPSLPVLFQPPPPTTARSSEERDLNSLGPDENKAAVLSSRMSFLPPRNHQHVHPLLQQKQSTPVTQATAGLRAFSIAEGSTEESQQTHVYHHAPMSRVAEYSCSPIPEHFAAAPSNRTGYSGSADWGATAAAPAFMESTDVASSGSLHKVRRIHRSDDVVAATGYHLSHLAPPPPRRCLRPLSVAPSGGGLSFDMMEDDKDGGALDDGVSPTDVMHFFPTPHVPKSGPPPTPIKQRPSYQPYGNRRQVPQPHLARTPGPPLLNRKTGGGLSSIYTPHPSLSNFSENGFKEQPNMTSVLDSRYHLEQRRSATTSTTNSRFYADFDIIGELGRGSFGNVYKVLSRLDGCMYAIKKAHRQAKGTADRDRMLKEVSTLHSNVPMMSLASSTVQTNLLGFQIFVVGLRVGGTL
jgi:hypothetical protein